MTAAETARACARTAQAGGSQPDVAVAGDWTDDIVAAAGMKGAEGLQRRGIELLGIPLAFQNVDAIAAVRQDEVQFPAGLVPPIADILLLTWGVNYLLSGLHSYA